MKSDKSNEVHGVDEVTFVMKSSRGEDEEVTVGTGVSTVRE